MKSKLFILTLGLALAAVVIGGRWSGGKAYAAWVNRFPANYASNAVADVATQGGTSGFYLPVNFLELVTPVSNTNNNLQVRVNAADSCQGSGLVASLYVYDLNPSAGAQSGYNGDWLTAGSVRCGQGSTTLTISLNGICLSHPDICKSGGVWGQSGLKVIGLRVAKILDSINTHVPYTVDVNDPSVKILMQKDPGYNQSTPLEIQDGFGNDGDHSSGFWMNTGVNTNGQFSLQWKADCNITAPTTVYLKWADADAGNQSIGQGGNTPGWRLTETGPTNQTYYLNWNGINNNNNQMGTSQLDTQLSSPESYAVTIYPGDTITWDWQNVSYSNAIAIASPFGNGLNDLGLPCTPPPGWHLSGDSSPSVPQVTTKKGDPTVDTVKFNHTITNSGPDQATYNWQVLGSYHGNSYASNHCGDNGTGVGSAFNDTGSNIGLCPGQKANLSYFDGTSQQGDGQPGQNHSEEYQFPSNAVPGDTYCEEIAFSEPNGPNTSSGSPSHNPPWSVADSTLAGWGWKFSTPACVVYNPNIVIWNGPATCTTISVTANTSYTIKIDGSDGSSNTAGPYSGSSTFDPFATWTFMRPHNKYIFTLQNATSGPATQLLGQCMAVSCPSDISFTGDYIEPGETTSMGYGIIVYNYTSVPYTEYMGSRTANPGLSMIPFNPIIVNNTLATLGNSTYEGGSWPVTASYTGTFSATLLFNGASINDLFSGLPCTSNPYTPQTRPYVDVKNGDASTGGGFKHKNATGATPECSTSDNYPRFVSPYTAYNWSGGSLGTNADYFGGIRTFAGANGSPYGSSSDFAAYALGLITGGQASPSKSGFYSNGFGGVGYYPLTFANVGDARFGPSTNLGGILGGSVGGAGDSSGIDANAHCVQDFFDQTVKDHSTTFTTVPANSQLILGSLAAFPAGINASGQYKVTVPAGSCLNLNGTVPEGASITLYVDGDVCINGNINYGPWKFGTINGVPNSNDAPYLAVIAKGNIYVQSAGVSEINGFFVAQPLDDASASKGVFSTCSSGDALPSGQLTAVCHSIPALTVNGAVAAQHVYALRVIGSLAGNDASGPAETFNFSPSVIVGQPDFQPEGNGTAVPNQLDSLVSLPPIL